MRRTRNLVLTAVFGALAIAFSILRLQLPYLPLPYLKLDFAELPVTLTLFLCGFKYAVAAELLHFLGLLIRGSQPIDASMKLLAVLSMLVGLAIPVRGGFLARLALAAASRSLFMSLMNYIYFYVLFPNFLGYALKLAGSVEALFILTAIFNIIHVAVSAGSTWLVYKEIEKRGILLQKA
ncbi:MAG: hypothetical protein QXT33_01395 [Thermofilum sp.]